MIFSKKRSPGQKYMNLSEKRRNRILRYIKKAGHGSPDEGGTEFTASKPK
jgi:hypothetical protein